MNYDSADESDSTQMSDRRARVRRSIVKDVERKSVNIIQPSFGDEESEEEGNYFSDRPLTG